VQLIIFSGLPGTGKSTVAEMIGRELGIPVFAKDWLVATLLRCSSAQNNRSAETLGYAGYELLTTLAQRQLSLGQSAILDSVATFEDIRNRWRDLAGVYCAQWRVIECICSDSVIHQTRLNARHRKIPNWPELTWADVERVRAHYLPWSDERLILDAADSLENSIAAALAYLRDS